MGDTEQELRDRCSMTTVSGRVIRILDPRPSDISITDIACGLARICRYGGQIVAPYSVAEHSVACANALPDGTREQRASLLLHDAAEAYVGDMIHPLKLALRSIGGGGPSLYDELEQGFQMAIAQRFGLRLDFAEHDFVKLVDNAACAREMEYLRTMPEGWTPHVEPLVFVPQCWDHKRAESEFLQLARELEIL